MEREPETTERTEAPDASSTTRRRLLLGGAAGLAGLVADAVISAQPASASTIDVVLGADNYGIDSRTGVGTADSSSSSVTDSNEYALLASPEDATVDADGASTGVVGVGQKYGVVGNGVSGMGVYGLGDTIGVFGSGGDYGIQATGNTGVYGQGETAGVFGDGTEGGVGVGALSGTLAPAMQAQATGTGPAVEGTISNVASTAPVIAAQSAGSGPGLQVQDTPLAFSAGSTGVTGTGGGIVAQLSNPSNDSAAIEATTAGTGTAIQATIDNSDNSSPTISATTNGTGGAILATSLGSQPAITANDSSASTPSLGTGPALIAQLNNPDNASPVVQAGSLGTGSAMEAYISNTSNSRPALGAMTGGTGSAIEAEITPADNSSPAISATTNGTGPAMLGTAGTTGIGVQGVGLGIPTAGAAVTLITSIGVQGVGGVAGVAGVDGGTGKNIGVAATLTNEANTSPALQATTLGLGHAIEATIDNTKNDSPAIRATTNGTGPAVLASSSTGTGLMVEGIASFSRSGVVSVTASTRSTVGGATVTGVTLSKSSLIFATVQDHVAGVGIAGVVADPAKNRFTIYLTQPVSTSISIAWFVIG